MFQLREPYTPPILAARPARAVASVGAAGAEYEVVSESPPERWFGRLPLSFVGEVAPGEKSETSTGEKVFAAIYLAPFLAGPPLVGWFLFGTIGAVGGALVAAPAIYLYVAMLANVK